MSLIAQWKMDEQVGTGIADSAGTNTGTWVGNGGQAITSVASPVGDGILFDGAADTITVPADPSIDALSLTAITMAMWVYAASLGEGNYGRIIDKRVIGASGYMVSLDTLNAGKVGLNFVVENGTAMTAITLPLVVINTWTHVACTFDRLDGVRKGKVYLDGVLVANGGTDTASDDSALPDDSAVGLNIGNNAATDRTFDGTISDARIYDTALTSEEIKQIMSTGGYRSDRLNNRARYN